MFGAEFSDLSKDRYVLYSQTLWMKEKVVLFALMGNAHDLARFDFIFEVRSRTRASRP